MHFNILSENQTKILPYLKPYKKSFYLVGGTAIALQIGHRKSIDFDLFSAKKLVFKKIHEGLSKIPFEKKIRFQDTDQIHLDVLDVKLTFFEYTYSIIHEVKINDVLTMPNLLTLAAMKGFTLGRRSKWKDYVDLYFLIKNHFTIEEIANEVERIFPNQSSQKLIRQQLAYHKDIDFKEQVEYIIPNPPSEQEIKDFLIDKAISFFE